MAKLEELSELLVSEIRDFEEAIKRLEGLKKNKIKLDFSDFEKMLFQFQQSIGTSTYKNNKQLMELKATIGKAKIYPKWLLLLIIFLVIMNCLLNIICIAIFWF